VRDTLRKKSASAARASTPKGFLRLHPNQQATQAKFNLLRQRFYDDVEAESTGLLHAELEVNQYRLIGTTGRQRVAQRNCARRQRGVIATADSLIRRCLQRRLVHKHVARCRPGTGDRIIHINFGNTTCTGGGEGIVLNTNSASEEQTRSS
jgi:hypothetical protein